MNPTILSKNELVMQQDYLNEGEYLARKAIRAYVENNEPIPNELKTILFEILDQNFRGKSKFETAAKWNLIVKEVIFKTKGTYISENGDVEHDESLAMTRNEAIEQVAKERDIEADTVARNYQSSKYRKIKDALKGVK